jgi:hypothetical protein
LPSEKSLLKIITETVFVIFQNDYIAFKYKSAERAFWHPLKNKKILRVEK